MSHDKRLIDYRLAPAPESVEPIIYAPPRIPVVHGAGLACVEHWPGGAADTPPGRFLSGEA